jgi:hypothetical protein
MRQNVGGSNARVMKLAAAAIAAINDPEVKKRMVEQGLEIVVSTPARVHRPSALGGQRAAEPVVHAGLQRPGGAAGRKSAVSPEPVAAVAHVRSTGHEPELGLGRGQCVATAAHWAGRAPMNHHGTVSRLVPAQRMRRDW